MKGLICDPIDFVSQEPEQKNVLRAETSKGVFEICCTNILILATHDSGERVAETFNRSENGLNWVKRRVKENYGLWNERIVWKIFPVS